MLSCFRYDIILHHPVQRGEADPDKVGVIYEVVSLLSMG